MKYTRENILSMQGYVPGEQPSGSGWIKLNQNENPYPPSPKAIAAMRAELQNLAHYPESTSPRVRVQAAELYNVDADQVLVTNGSDELLRILLETCINPGDKVVAFYPSYTYYRTLTAIQDGRYEQIGFNDDYSLPERFRVDDARIVFLPNPNAPSGTLFSRDDIAGLCSRVENGLVVIDEAYADFANVSAIPLLAKYDNLFVTRTLSKSYSLAGLRVGLGFGHVDLIRQMDKVRDFYDVDRVAQAGAAAALADQDYFMENVGRICRERARIMNALLPRALHVWPSSANFVLARFGKPDASELFTALRARKILVRHFSAPRLDDCLRISVGTAVEVDGFIAAIEELVPLKCRHDRSGS